MSYCPACREVEIFSGYYCNSCENKRQQEMFKGIRQKALSKFLSDESKSSKSFLKSLKV